MKPEINLISADSTHISTPSALSEVTDNLTAAVGFEGVVGVVREGKKKVETEVGEVKRIWDGLLDDVLGVKTKTA